MPLERAPYLLMTVMLFTCLLLYAVGWWWAVNGEPLAFARSGAAATAACIALSIWDCRRVLAAAADRERTALVSVVEALCQGGSRQSDQLSRAILVRPGGRLGRAERLTTRIQAMLLVTATLVWGFGDLPFA